MNARNAIVSLTLAFGLGFALPTFAAEEKCAPKSPELRLAKACGSMDAFASGSRYLGAVQGKGNANYCYNSYVIVNRDINDKAKVMFFADNNGKVRVKNYELAKKDMGKAGGHDLIKLKDEASCFVYDAANAEVCKKMFIMTRTIPTVIQVGKVGERTTVVPIPDGKQLQETKEAIEMPSNVDYKAARTVLIEDLKSKLVGFAKTNPQPTNPDDLSMANAYYHCVDFLNSFATKFGISMSWDDSNLKALEQKFPRTTKPQIFDLTTPGATGN